MQAIKPRVLFLCIHNSGRSQMAEAYLNKLGGNRFEVESAGLEPGKLNPVVAKVMAEDGIDLSANATKDVFSFHEKGVTFNYVITVCDAKNSERCPYFPGEKRIAWDFEDPSAIQGSEEEKLLKTREIRDQIKAAVENFVASS